jgi:hypothetical protein
LEGRVVYDTGRKNYLLRNIFSSDHPSVYILSKIKKSAGCHLFLFFGGSCFLYNLFLYTNPYYAPFQKFQDKETLSFEGKRLAFQDHRLLFASQLHIDFFRFHPERNLRVPYPIFLVEPLIGRTGYHSFIRIIDQSWRS